MSVQLFWSLVTLLPFLFDSSEAGYALAANSTEIFAKQIQSIGNRTLLAMNDYQWTYHGECASTSEISAGGQYKCCASTNVGRWEYNVRVPSSSDDNIQVDILPDKWGTTGRSSSKCRIYDYNTKCEGDPCNWFPSSTKYDCKRSATYNTNPIYDKKSCIRVKCTNSYMECHIYSISAKFYIRGSYIGSSPLPSLPSPSPSPLPPPSSSPPSPPSPFSASDGTWIEQQKIYASDGRGAGTYGSTSELGDHFGHSVAIDGSTALVGAYRDTTTYYQSGSASIFARSGTNWNIQQNLVAGDRKAYDGFGHSVAIDGDFALIGIANVAGVGHKGAAYVFVRSDDDWTFQAKLVGSDSRDYDLFGWSVALSGDTAIIGAPQHSWKGPSSSNNYKTSIGAAYVFSRSGSTWNEDKKISASNGDSFDQFGKNVAIHGNTVLVSTSRNSPASNSVYIYIRSGSTWSEQKKLTSSDWSSKEHSGIAIHGSTALVGSPASNSAYVYVRSGSTWSQQQKLTPSGGALNFGYDVSIDGHTAVVGTSGSGNAYVFVRSENIWSQTQKLEGTTDKFGIAVNIKRNYLIIGARDDNSERGSAYVFWFPPPPPPPIYSPSSVSSNQSISSSGTTLTDFLSLMSTIAVALMFI